MTLKGLLFLLVCSILMGGCFLLPDEDPLLRTVPVTNNPNVVPRHGSFPGIPTGTE